MRAFVLRWLAVLVIAVLAAAAWRVGTRRQTASRPTVVTSSPSAPDELLVRTATVEGSLTPAPSGAELIGRTAGFRLLEYGAVAGYRSGAVSHSAPSGQRLIAFRIAAVPGEAGQSAPHVALRIDGVERGPLAITDDYIVASVPLAAQDAALVLDDGGVRQSISLLDGRPADNVVVCTRAHRSASVGSTRNVSIQVRNSSGVTGLTSGVFTLRAVTLSYWAADGSHPGSADRALLHIQASVRFTGDQTSYGAEPGLLSVTTADGTKQTVRNAAADRSAAVDAVAEVPAGLTGGTVSYSGSMTSGSSTLTVLTPVSIQFSITAG